MTDLSISAFTEYINTTYNEPPCSLVKHMPEYELLLALLLGIVRVTVTVVLSL